LILIEKLHFQDRTVRPTKQYQTNYRITFTQYHTQSASVHFWRYW